MRLGFYISRCVFTFPRWGFTFYNVFFTFMRSAFTFHDVFFTLPRWSFTFYNMFLHLWDWVFTFHYVFFTFLRWSFTSYDVFLHFWDCFFTFRDVFFTFLRLVVPWSAALDLMKPFMFSSHLHLAALATIRLSQLTMERGRVSLGLKYCPNSRSSPAGALGRQTSVLRLYSWPLSSHSSW